MFCQSNGSTRHTERTTEFAGYARRWFLRGIRQGVLALAQCGNHVIELAFVNDVTASGIGLREQAHKVTAVMAAEIAGPVVPTSRRLRSLGVQAGGRAEIAQHPV